MSCSALFIIVYMFVHFFSYIWSNTCIIEGEVKFMLFYFVFFIFLVILFTHQTIVTGELTFMLFCFS